MPSPALLLLLLLLLVPLVEIGVFIQVGGLIGLWPTLGLTVLTAVIGTFCIRVQGVGLVARARTQLAAGEAPVFELVSGVCLVLAGALLLTPGFVTDALGFALLLPPVRRFCYDRFLADRLQVMAADQAGAGRSVRPVVIEGEYDTLDDVAGEMPPPGGGWDRRR